MDAITLMHRACRAAFEAEAWEKTNPGLARLRRRDAENLTAMARERNRRNQDAKA